ncbi:hypothetical protein M409DRAFT_50686 [Zasmidium cellare ATCC 36951]|uniref:Uncharacterized protein n=1 Tax=Zasmidium cellare ATCC 36951 TaxID=1080233 RepID=A0A6A6CYH5_ZASCE|nr:uncharacterized protein M409DRAFT_50686 [Zasmidium cellare ATCC 36951]KAF2171218.1 hypothetical protein M409DRAFT_50686 [Zasmidium cellare ATCC 36951]
MAKTKNIPGREKQRRREDPNWPSYLAAREQQLQQWRNDRTRPLTSKEVKKLHRKLTRASSGMAQRHQSMKEARPDEEDVKDTIQKEDDGLPTRADEEGFRR